jgi:hypothetical protein
MELFIETQSLASSIKAPEINIKKCSEEDQERIDSFGMGMDDILSHSSFASSIYAPEKLCKKVTRHIKLETGLELSKADLSKVIESL